MRSLNDNIIYVDIDGTICHTVESRYENSVPYHNRIERINSMYDDGFTIVYWTARGSKTGIDWLEFTEKQLKAWGALYDRLEMKKPQYNLFIDDRALNSEEFFR